MTDCVFCKIIQGKIPCTKVYEDDSVFAFLDIHPANKGHTLVLPKKHYEILTDLPQKELHKLIDGVQKISKAIIEEGEGFNILENNRKIAGQEVPHVHFHIIPRNKIDGHELGFKRTKYEDGEADKVANRIKNLLK